MVQVMFTGSRPSRDYNKVFSNERSDLPSNPSENTHNPTESKVRQLNSIRYYKYIRDDLSFTFDLRFHRPSFCDILVDLYHRPLLTRWSLGANGYQTTSPTYPLIEPYMEPLLVHSTLSVMIDSFTNEYR